MELEAVYEEIKDMLASIEPGEEGQHIWSNYQSIVAIVNRLTEIHNEIAYEEIVGRASPELKKFRTMILDPTIDNLNKNATFESRKITGQQMEWELEKRG